MTDCMNFPATVEEFMEQYKIIDTEQIYTNGIELVPIFRMKQWFEHQPSVDIIPVVHGHWIRHENADIICGYYVPSFECSQCGAWKEDNSDFCPDCGAKMDGGNEQG